MLRFLAFLIVVLLLWMLLSAVLQRLRRGAARSTGHQARQGGADAAPVEHLVRCEECGVRVPQSRALPAPGGAVFCSEACRHRAGAGPERRS